MEKALLVLLTFLIFGCSVGPKYAPPELGLDIPQRYDGTPGGALAPPDLWWTVFGDPVLERLVEEALEANWDLKEAAARVLELQAELGRARAERLPKLQIGATAQRRRYSTEMPFPTPRTKTFITDSYDLSFAASFEVDLWRRLQRASEATRWELLAQQETRQALAQGLVAEVVGLYFRFRTLQRRVQIASEILRVEEEILKTLQGRYLRGLLPLLEVKAARRRVEAASASLSSLEMEGDEVLRQISLLLGRYPHTLPLEGPARDYLRALRPVPPGLPSELLLRRPDLRAMEKRLRALTERVGVARAARFPRLSLTGSYGYSSEDLQALFRPESLLWRLAAGLVAPIFEGGRLKAAEDVARAKLRQAEAEYAKKVLQAFYEVEVALQRRKSLWDRYRRLEASLEEARQMEAILVQRYRRGLVDRLKVLEAQRERLRAEDELALVELAILTNRVALHRALGGGWPELEEAR